MAYGDKPFSLKSIKVAALNADGTYSAAVDLPHARKCTATPNTTTGTLVGTRGRTAAVATVVKDATLEIDAGGYTWDALAVMLGEAVTTTGTTPAQIKSQPIPVGSNLPYFGVIAELDDDDGGDFHLGFPKVKLTALPPIEALGEEEAFVKNVFEALAIADDDGYVVYPVAHETAIAGNFTTAFS